MQPPGQKHLKGIRMIQRRKKKTERKSDNSTAKNVEQQLICINGFRPARCQAAAEVVQAGLSSSSLSGKRIGAAMRNLRNLQPACNAQDALRS